MLSCEINRLFMRCSCWIGSMQGCGSSLVDSAMAGACIHFTQCPCAVGSAASSAAACSIDSYCHHCPWFLKYVCFYWSCRRQILQRQTACCMFGCPGLMFIRISTSAALLMLTRSLLCCLLSTWCCCPMHTADSGVNSTTNASAWLASSHRAESVTTYHQGPAFCLSCLSLSFI